MPLPGETLIESIRKRPSMYIGTTETFGLQHLLYETLENALDQFRVGQATELRVTFHNDASITVEDNGSGVAVAPLPEFDGRSLLEVVFTEASAGGRLTYGRYGRGPNVGLASVNALSEELLAESRWKGQRAAIRFRQGRVVEPLDLSPSDAGSGLRLRFRPDPGIFKDVALTSDLVEKLVWEQAVLAPGVRIVFRREADNKSSVYRFPLGVVEFVRNECGEQETLWPEIVRMEARLEELRFELAIQFAAANESRYCAFVNGRNTPDGGVHVAACRWGMSTALRRLVNPEPDTEGSWPPGAAIARIDHRGGGRHARSAI